jgi:hypothetical protein
VNRTNVHGGLSCCSVAVISVCDDAATDVLTETIGDHMISVSFSASPPSRRLAQWCSSRVGVLCHFLRRLGFCSRLAYGFLEGPIGVSVGIGVGSAHSR